MAATGEATGEYTKEPYDRGWYRNGQGVYVTLQIVGKPLNVPNLQRFVNSLKIHTHYITYSLYKDNQLASQDTL